MKKNIKLWTIWTISWSYKNLICGNPAVNSQWSPSPSLVQRCSATPQHRQWQLSCPGLAVQSDARSGKLSDRMILSHNVPVLASHTCCAPLFFCFSLLTVEIIPPQKILSLKYWILINPLSPLFVSFNSCLISYGKPPFCFLHILLGFIIYLHHVSFSSFSSPPSYFFTFLFPFVIFFIVTLCFLILYSSLPFAFISIRLFILTLWKHSGMLYSVVANWAC